MPAPIRTAAPPPGPEPELHAPNWVTRRLANGLRVDVHTDHRTPDVAIRLLADAGAGRTANDEAGLATLAGELLIEGADGRSPEAMARWLDEMGASFLCRTGYDNSVVSMHALAHQLENALDLLSASACRPDFAGREVARAREKRVDRIRRRADEPAEIAGERLIAAIFADHPYGVPADGTAASVERLDDDALRTFWFSRVRPSTAAIVISGDVAVDVAFEAAGEAFGVWNAKGADSESVPRPATRAQRAGEVLLVDRPASRQTEIRIGGVGLARDGEGEIPALVMNAILGGLFSSRINMNLREDKGWTYGARTTFLRRLSPGPFVVRTAVDTEVTAGAFEEIRRECDAMLAEPPTADELTMAKNALTLGLPLQFETNSQVAGRRVEALTYGLGDDYWATYREAIRGVRPEEVQAAACRFLAPDDLVYLAVGDVGRFAGNLSSLGSVQVMSAE